METDILIIGGGVTGTAIARELSRYNLDIVLVEKDADIATGTSKANSGIIHAGYNASPDTVKGVMNIKSHSRFDKICDDLKVPFARIGSMVVGFNNNDLKKLKKKKKNGEKQGVKDLEIIDKDKLFKLEPNLNKKAKYALLAPTAGIISPFELAIAFADNAVVNGVRVLLNTKVNNIKFKNGILKKVETSKKDIKPKLVINAAGLYADKIANMGGDNIKITPRKGEYFLFDKEYNNLVNHVLFPMPSKKSKGILVTPTIHGNLMIGPNANWQEDKNDKSTTETGLKEVVNGAKKLIPDLPGNGVINSFAGLRAAAEGEDFIIGFSKSSNQLINVAGIQSPGLSSAPAIAEKVVELVKYYYKDSDNIYLNKKDNFIEELPSYPRFSEYEGKEEDWQDVFTEDHNYGEIICRCESVTRGEIIKTINRPVPATTVDAVKRRTRAGMGRCQGGFCGPRVVEIISEELNISPLEVTKKGGNSRILKARTKELIDTKNNIFRKKAGDNNEK
ncbi:MAG: NAD(P)/FAD-dependent oxidoreductase [Halanaerobiaceae bacterium]